MKYSLAGCVICYNPDDNVIKNIETYINVCEILYLVDNGNAYNLFVELKRKYDNIVYLFHKENKGISFSLNEVLQKINTKFDFLLTMDQDSFFEGNNLKRYLNEIHKFNWQNTLGIGPQIFEQAPPQDDWTNVQWEENLRVITSGNIINVKIAYKIGGWDDKLFIDEVDHEICYRGYLHGYKNFVCSNGVYLNHSLGVTVEKRYLFKKIKIKNYHNYIRTYYMVRNRLYVYRKYHKIDELGFLKFYILDIYHMFFFILKKEK